MIKKLFLMSFVIAGLLLSTAAQAVPPPVQNDGNDPNLIGWWKLDESSGTTAADSKGADNNGTISVSGSFNTWSWGETGKFGTGLTMNTANTIMGARLQVPMTGMRAEKGTVAMWAKLTTQPAVASTGVRYFTGWQGRTVSAGKTNDRVQLYLSSISGDPEAYTELCVGFGDQNKLDQFIKHMNIGDWYHLAMTWNQTNATTGDGDYLVYVNGIDMPTGTILAGYTPNTYKNLSGMAYNAQLGNNMGDIGAAKNEGGAATLDEVGFYDAILTRSEVVALAGADPNKAYNPTPENGKQDIGRNPTLSWSAGTGATSHDVYFGTDSTAPASQGNQTATTWTPASTLEFNKWYYWRIDERDGGGLRATGDLWSLRTVTGQAADPYPLNGAYNVAVPPAPDKGAALSLKLGWKPGDVSGITHDVYFNTADVTDSNRTSGPGYIGNQAIGVTTYTPASILLDARYYWRIDEVQSYPTLFKGATWTFTTNPIYYADNFQTYASATILKNAWKATGTTSSSYIYQDVAGTDKAVDFWYDNQTSPYFAGIKRSVPATQSASRDYTFGNSAKSVRVSYKADANTDQIYVRLWSGANSVKKVASVTEDSQWHDAWWKLSDFGVATSVTAIEVGEGNDTIGSGAGYLYLDDVRVQAISYEGELPGDIQINHKIDYNDVDLISDSWLDAPVSLVKGGAFNRGAWGTNPPNAQSPSVYAGNDPNVWPKYWYLWNDINRTESGFALTIDNTDGKNMPCAKIDLDMSTTAWNDGAICQTIDVCDFNGQELLISFMHRGDITAQDNTMYEYRPTMDGCDLDFTAGEPIIKRVQRGGGTSCPDCYGALSWDWEPYTHVYTVNVNTLDRRSRPSRYLHLHHRLGGRADSSSNPVQWLKVDQATITVYGGAALPAGDITLDGVGEKNNAVDFVDYAILANNWLETQPSIPPQ